MKVLVRLDVESPAFEYCKSSLSETEVASLMQELLQINGMSYGKFVSKYELKARPQYPIDQFPGNEPCQYHDFFIRLSIKVNGVPKNIKIHVIAELKELGCIDCIGVFVV